MHQAGFPYVHSAPSLHPYLLTYTSILTSSCPHTEMFTTLQGCMPWPIFWFDSPKCLIIYQLFTSTSHSMNCPTRSCDDSKAKWKWTKGTKTFANKSAPVYRCLQEQTPTNTHTKTLLTPSVKGLLCYRCKPFNPFKMQTFWRLGNATGQRKTYERGLWVNITPVGVFDIVHQCKRTVEPTHRADQTCAAWVSYNWHISAMTHFE